MSRNALTIAAAAALFAAVTLWFTPAFPAPLPADAPRLAERELAGLSDLGDALRRTLRDEEDRLRTSCDFEVARDRLVDVREVAVGAIRVIGGLWREGRFRHGGFALSEVLVYDFAAVIEEARQDIALADTLVILQHHARVDAEDARVIVARIARMHPPAAGCFDREALGAAREPRARAR